MDRSTYTVAPHKIIKQKPFNCEIMASHMNDPSLICSRSEKHHNISELIKNATYAIGAIYLFAKLFYLLYYDGVEYVIHLAQI